MAGWTPLALLLTVRVDERAPAAVGVKITVKVVVPLGGSVLETGGEFLNSLFVLLMVMGRLLLVLFVTVTV